MPAWVAPAAIAAGTSLLGELFGGGGGYKTSPQQEKMWKHLLIFLVAVMD